MAQLVVQLLGPLQITLAGARVTNLESDKVRALLIYLLTEAHRPQRREALAGLLWPDLSERAARHNLSQALFNLRRVLGEQAAATPLLVVTHDAIQLNPAADYQVDARTFSDLLAACDGHQHQHLRSCADCAGRLAAATALYAGDFLAQFSLVGGAPFEEWAAGRREQLRQQQMETLELLADYHERRGAIEEARRFAERLVGLEPLRESTHRQLMRLLTLAGRRALALAQYERCRAILEAELGVEPEAETTALYEQVRAADGGAPLVEHRLAPPTPGPNNLPLQLTAFVGREQELAALATTLNDPACRLLTLLGPGGIGKTRLALQAAAEQLESFADGAYFVALAGLRDPELIADAIREALRLGSPGPEGPREQVLAHLGERQLLLVVDNCEHLIVGADLLADVLARAGGVTILATSRERLGLPGEWLMEVGGLAVPEGDAATELHSAVALFVHCARRMRAGFTLLPADEPHVAETCRLVEGMPLAIELAAGWTRTLTCAEIVAELRRGLAFLSSSARHIPERHRSLQAVVDHSWQLLTPEEQAVARRLAVFHGGCQRGMAEQVAGATLPLLASLVDKSLLRCSVAGRYTMHEVVAQVLRGQLALSGEQAEVQARHLHAYIALAEEGEQELLGPNQLAWLDGLEAEHDNLRAALRGAFERREAEAMARLGAALWRFWWIRNHAAEGRRWLEQMLRLEGLASDLRARILHGAGVLTHEQGDYAQARAHYAQSLALRRALGDRQGVASSLNSLGVAAMDQRDYPGAAALFEESLTLKRALGDERGIGSSLNNLAMVLSAQGDYERAKGLYEESLALQRRLGGRFAVATVLGNLGAVTLEQGELARARAHFTESLALFQELGDKDGIAECLEGLAGVAVGAGEPQEGARRAAWLCGAAAALRRTIGTPLIPVEQQRFEAILSLVRARLGDAELASLCMRGENAALEQAIAYALSS